MSNKTDLDLLLECVAVLDERRRAVLGEDDAVVCAADDGVMNETLMHGDLIDAADLDKFSRLAGFLHYRTMMDAMDEVEGYTLVGGMVGLIEEAVIVGILWERKRRKLVALGEMNPKVGDIV